LFVIQSSFALQLTRPQNNSTTTANDDNVAAVVDNHTIFTLLSVSSFALRLTRSSVIVLYYRSSLAVVVLHPPQPISGFAAPDFHI